MVGRENVYFVVFEDNRFILDVMEIIPEQNVITISTKSPFALAIGALRAVLRARKIGQVQRADGPATHMGKHGTPTMGGMLIALTVCALSYSASFSVSRTSVSRRLYVNATFIVGPTRSKSV